ncbi:hypothetical protein HQ585_10075 [candidate division KSB1 bacterium]|nr:hypothetical protein [candidate division KSB1 bacterium]
MKRLIVASLLITIPLFFYCAAYTSLQPVGKDRITGNFSIGGPIISAFGTRIPVPYGTAGLNYGLSDQTNLNSNLHMLSLAYQVAGLDVGVTWFPVQNEGWIPTIGLAPRCLMLMSLKSDVTSRFRAYPLVTTSALWKKGNGHIYTGLDIIIPFSEADYDDEAVSIIFSPFAGYRLPLSDRLNLLTEIKWMGANVESDQLAVEYVPVNGYGAVTTLFSIERRF